MIDPIEPAIRRLGLAFPDAEAFISHGAPNFRVRKAKVFAIYAMNHHGDGRIALWLNVPSGMQQDLVRAEPKHFFVPAYVGAQGWVGMRLDQGIAWTRVTHMVRVAYERVAPARLVETLRTPRVPAPRRRVTVDDLDPKNSPRGKRVMASMRKICLALPATAEGLQFGQPVWKAGKRTFAQAYCYDDRWRVAFWVGIDAQGFMTTDPRFEIPAYMGHNGWIALDVAKQHDERELAALARASYRHFATKKLLRELGD